MASSTIARREAQARWKAKNPTYYLGWARRKRAGSAEFRKKESDKSRRWQLDNPLKNAWLQYRSSAARRGITFELTRDVLNMMVVQACYYCGREAEPVNGIDRVENDQPYRLGNVVTACARCNRAKGTSTVQEFAEWADKLAAGVAAWRP